MSTIYSLLNCLENQTLEDQQRGLSYTVAAALLSANRVKGTTCALAPSAMFWMRVPRWASSSWQLVQFFLIVAPLVYSHSPKVQTLLTTLQNHLTSQCPAPLFIFTASQTFSVPLCPTARHYYSPILVKTCIF